MRVLEGAGTRARGARRLFFRASGTAFGPPATNNNTHLHTPTQTHTQTQPQLAGGDDPERAFRLKTAEIKHGRLAMVAFLGFVVQQSATGEGVLGSLSAFGKTF